MDMFDLIVILSLPPDSLAGLGFMADRGNGFGIKTGSTIHVGGGESPVGAMGLGRGKSIIAGTIEKPSAKAEDIDLGGKDTLR